MNSSFPYVLLFIFLALSCARHANPDIERGSDYKYRSGFPEVRTSAMGFLNEDNQPNINIAADIVYGSLIFKEVDGEQKASVSIDVDIRSKDNNDVVINSKHFNTDIKKKDISITKSQQSYLFQKQLEVPSGNYEIDITVTDENSDKRTTRSSTVSIPRPDSKNIGLTNIRMLGKNIQIDSSWYPITTYDVPGRVDSLMFVIQVTNNSNDKPLAVHTNLFQIEADTSVARPLYFNNYSRSTIEYQGIDYDDKYVLQNSTRKLLENGSVFIEYRFKRQQRGNYRFEVRTQKNDIELFKARDFSVKSTNYPALRTPRELAQPLIYLMKEKNYESMMAIQDQDSLKKAIDEFWLRKIGSKVEARQVLEKYYHRVEEANKQFSNFKEGWKTDPGMIYILFGPPWYVQNTLGEMEWNYSYNREEFGRTFFFEQPKLNSEFYPFNHFLLQRDNSLYSLEYQQRQLWLSGLILKRNL